MKKNFDPTRLADIRAHLAQLPAPRGMRFGDVPLEVFSRPELLKIFAIQAQRAAPPAHARGIETK